jgi:hypothetical protein
MKIYPVGPELSHVDRQDMTRLIAALRNSVNGTKLENKQNNFAFKLTK